MQNHSKLNLIKQSKLKKVKNQTVKRDYVKHLDSYSTQMMREGEKNEATLIEGGANTASHARWKYVSLSVPVSVSVSIVGRV